MIAFLVLLAAALIVISILVHVLVAAPVIAVIALAILLLYPRFVKRK